MVGFMVFNATFNNIDGGNRSTQRKPPTCCKFTGQLYHTMLCTSPWWRFDLTTSLVIGTCCIGSCNSNYHTITGTLIVKSGVKHHKTNHVPLVLYLSIRIIIFVFLSIIVIFHWLTMLYCLFWLWFFVLSFMCLQRNRKRYIIWMGLGVLDTTVCDKVCQWLATDKSVVFSVYFGFLHQ
jgi:hypothetical protein